MELSKKEFQALLLIHGAYIDYEFHPKEKKYIINLYGQATFDKMLMAYLTGREKSFDYLKHNLDKYCPNASEKLELKNLLFGVLLADDSYSQMEKAFLSLFRTRINTAI